MDYQTIRKVISENLSGSLASLHVTTTDGREHHLDPTTIGYNNDDRQPAIIAYPLHTYNGGQVRFINEALDTQRFSRRIAISLHTIVSVQPFTGDELL